MYALLYCPACCKWCRLILQAAQEGIVLLKNDNLLPKAKMLLRLRFTLYDGDRPFHQQDILMPCQSLEAWLLLKMSLQS